MVGSDQRMRHLRHIAEQEPEINVQRGKVELHPNI